MTAALLMLAAAGLVALLASAAVNVTILVGDWLFRDDDEREEKGQ